MRSLRAQLTRLWSKPKSSPVKRKLSLRDKGSIDLALVITLVIMVIVIVAILAIKVSIKLEGNRDEIQKVGATPSLQQSTQE